VIQGDIGVQAAVGADAGLVADDAVRSDHGACTNHRAAADHGTAAMLASPHLCIWLQPLPRDGYLQVGTAADQQGRDAREIKIGIRVGCAADRWRRVRPAAG